MDRENRGRKNLSAWEQGRMYSDALSTGLYPSMRKMAESLGVNLSDASRSVQIAKLPATVVAAFASPLDIQFRWAKPLTDALQKDPDGVLAIAKQLTDDRARRSPTEVFEQLVGKEAKAVSAEIDVSAAGQVVARISSKGKGQTIVVFEPNVLSVEKVQALEKLLSEFLAK
jgi:ParB family chromosome partitioning protein